MGVSRDFRTGSLGDDPVPQIYLPLAQRVSRRAASGERTLVARADGAVVRRGRRHRPRRTHRIDPSLPVLGIRSFETEPASQLLAQRLGSALLGLFGRSLLLGLAALRDLRGGCRTRSRAALANIGIRMALGARAADVKALVLSQRLPPIAAGLVLGVVLGAAEARRAPVEFLFEVFPPLDPLTFAAVPLLLGRVRRRGGAAARSARAARIDPMGGAPGANDGPGPPLRAARPAAEPRLERGRHPHARPRHRRGRGDLQRRARGPDRRGSPTGTPTGSSASDT